MNQTSVTESTVKPVAGIIGSKSTFEIGPFVFSCTALAVNPFPHLPLDLRPVFFTPLALQSIYHY